MITGVVMPQLGLEVSEGSVAAIHVELGEQVSRDDPLLELETDKALAEVPAPADGFVRTIDVAVGDTVVVGQALMRLSDAPDEPLDEGRPPEEPESEDPPAQAAAPRSNGGNGNASGAGPFRIRAAPLARRAAASLGVELESISGSGPNGRITLGDVERAAGASGDPRPSVEELSGTRRAIARRMTASQRIPQFHLVRDLDATWLLAQKDELEAAPSVNDLLVQAIAEMVSRHPALAASFVEGDDRGQPTLERDDGVDVGLAVATDRGLLVPVIRDAHERSLGDLAAERRRLTEAARGGRLGLEEMTGATITLSNLGGFGVDRFNAMLNPGESAIVAVGRAVDRVVPRERGLAVVPVLTVTVTFDHRAVDGATGGRALAELAELLEGEMQWRG